MRLTICVKVSQPKTCNWDEIRTSDLAELVLLDHILHLFLLLFTSDHVFYELCNLRLNILQSGGVFRPKAQTSNKVSGSIFKRLIVFSSDTLARRKEVDSKEREFAFIAFGGVFNGINMERNWPAHNR